MTCGNNLADLRNYLYERAELLWQVSLVIGVAALGLTVTALWRRDPFWVSLTGLVSVLLPAAIGWIREHAVAYQLRADKCRRMILYADGLGRDIPPVDIAKVKLWAAGKSLVAAPFTRPYYASLKPPGPRRLADIVTESAFFTEYLASKLHMALWIVFGLALAASVCALYLLGLTSGFTNQELVIAAKSVAVFIAFLISGDLALLAKKYGDLRDEARCTYEQCARLRENENVTAEEVRAVVEDYNIALLNCPPIPCWLYTRCRDVLNQIYRDSHFVPHD